MLTLNLSAGTIFTIGFVAGLITGTVGLAVVAVATNKKKNKEN